MKKFSRRHKINLLKTKNIKFSTLTEAIEILKETSTANFIESLEFHANLYVDPKYADQQLRTTVTLPYEIGKKLVIAVLTKPEHFPEAKEAGADIIGYLDLINDIKTGHLNFDLLIATSDIMPQLAQLGRILGPKGLMPSPKSGTVTTNLINTITEFKKGKFEYKTDKNGSVHIIFGKSNFPEVQLVKNLIALYKSIEQNRPPGVKGKYFKNIFIASTMGPSIKVPLDILAQD